MNTTQSLLPRLLPIVTTVGAAALLAFAVFNTVNTYRLTQKETQGESTTPRGQTRPATQTGSINLAQIPSWHLFGKKSAQKKAAPAPKIIDAPTTSLKLTLQGTFMGKSKTEESWAIISSADDEQKMYRVGDEIPGGATLYSVEPFRVILERNKRHESLSLVHPSIEGDEQSSITIEDDDQSSITTDSQPVTTSNKPKVRPKRARRPTPPSANRHTEREALREEMERIRGKFAK